MKHFKLVCFVLLLPVLLSAQKKWEGGVFLGITTYHGDLVKPSFSDFKEVNLGVSLFGRYLVNKTWGVRANLLFSRLNGDDANYQERKTRGFTFESPYTEFTVTAEWEPYGFKRYPEKDVFKRMVSPYFFAGLGLAFTNPEPDFSQNELDFNQEGIAADQNADFSKTSFALPLGVGIKIDLNERWLIGLEAGYRFPFSDYLDGISEAAGSDNNDNVILGGATVSARF